MDVTYTPLAAGRGNAALLWSPGAVEACGRICEGQADLPALIAGRINTQGPLDAAMQERRHGRRPRPQLLGSV